MNGGMTHQQIQDNEVIERYVRQKLTPAERQAFQEHFFQCDECFEQAQITARFIAGVREAAESGVLAPNRVPLNKAGGLSFPISLLRPMIAFSFAASLLFAVAFAWLWFSQVPGLRREIASEREARQKSEQETRRTLEDSRQQLEGKQRQLEAEQAQRAKLKEQLQQVEANNTRPRPDKNLIAQANIPTVTLESSRDSGDTENRLTIPAEARRVLLLIPVESGSRFESFEVQILTRTNSPVGAIMRASPNQFGALRINVPASRLQPGEYLIKLHGRLGPQRELLGEYGLRVVRK